MVSRLFYYQLALLTLVWLFLMLHVTWRKRGVTPPPTSAQPEPRPPKRTCAHEPTPFAGLTHKPHCALCERDAAHPQAPPPVPPDPMPPTNRRPREVDTSRHFCPHAGCDYRGWLGLGNLRANGHPSGGPWRQFHCTSCKGYFLETHGTIFHGKQAAVELIVRVLACLAEGLGIRATARVFEVDPHTVLHWLAEAAEQLRAFSAYFLYDLHLEQLQLDELYAVLRAFKAGEINEDQAIKRLERAPSWVWTVMDPKSKLLVVVDVGCRTLAMAQRVVHQVTPSVGARLCAAVSNRRVQRVSDGNTDPFWPVDSPRASPGQRPHAQAALDAAVWAPLRTSREVLPAPTPRGCQAPRGVRHPAGHRTGLDKL
jgi:transposase-like protein